MSVPLDSKRVAELYRMNKRQLAEIYRERSGYVWSPAPPERWSKDQLVTYVLELEP